MKLVHQISHLGNEMELIEITICALCGPAVPGVLMEGICPKCLEKMLSKTPITADKS